MIFIILGALFIIMAVPLTIGYVVQTNANQTAMQYAEAHMRPHTYHITSIAKSDDTKQVSTKEGIQFIIEPDDKEWQDYRAGDVISVTYAHSKPDKYNGVRYKYTITNKLKSEKPSDAPTQTQTINWNNYQKVVDQKRNHMLNRIAFLNLLQEEPQSNSMKSSSSWSGGGFDGGGSTGGW